VVVVHQVLTNILENAVVDREEVEQHKQLAWDAVRYFDEYILSVHNTPIYIEM
jgi:hypothetical protein